MGDSDFVRRNGHVTRTLQSGFCDAPSTIQLFAVQRFLPERKNG
jgi:hypothetical protein